MAELGNGHYDAIVAQDVLEHVEDPVSLAAQLAGALREGGIAVFANCFHPLTQCHPRHSFPRVMDGALGLRYLGVVEGAEHAQAFRRCSPLFIERARGAERISRILGPALNLVCTAMSRVKRLVLR